MGYAAQKKAADKTRKYAAYVGAGRIFKAAVWETYGRMGKGTLELMNDLSKADWVQHEWGGGAGLTPAQASAQYRARLMQRCSLLQMQASVQYCVLKRVRGAMVYHRGLAPVAGTG